MTVEGGSHSLLTDVDGVAGIRYIEPGRRTIHRRPDRWDSQRPTARGALNVTVQIEPASRTWMRYLRFSVRTMIVLVLVIGAAMGWVVHRARVQRDAVAAIRKAGGSIWYDWQFKGNSHTPNGEPRGPRWLVEALGVDYFGYVAVVSGTELFSDHELVLVESLGHLERLMLYGSSVTDAGLAHVRDLRNLEYLWLNGTRAGDAGLAYLKRLTRLKVLSLDKTWVTDAGLANLRGLIDLESLGLADTTVTDAGLDILEVMPKLRGLSLGGTRLHDVSMAHMRRLERSPEPRVEQDGGQ